MLDRCENTPVTDDLDVIGAYYHYIQNSLFRYPRWRAPLLLQQRAMRNAPGDVRRHFLSQWIGDLRQSGISISGQ